MKGLIVLQDIKQSNRFEKAVLKYFPKKEDYLYLESVGMKRTGAGHYQTWAAFSYCGEYLEFTDNHTNAGLFDWYKEVEEHSRPYENWFKAVVLDFLDRNKDAEEFKEFAAEKE